jgi:hypothetical protein
MPNLCFHRIIEIYYVAKLTRINDYIRPYSNLFYFFCWCQFDNVMVQEVILVLIIR